MRSLGKTFALILLCITVSGCSHKTKATPPQAAQAAPIAPATTYAKNGTTPQLPPSLLDKVAGMFLGGFFRGPGDFDGK